MEDFEPRIVGFLCNWCSYSGADAAGRAQSNFTPNLKIIRIMCSGRFDPQFVVKAFKEGADGVLILGCHPGDCHYKEGNYKAVRRYGLLKNVLKDFGIEDGRFRLDWVSASEGEKFVKVTTEFAEEVKRLGPFVMRDKASLSKARHIKRGHYGQT